MFVSFVTLVLVLNYVLTRTGWGRSVFAIGGNVEAARRAGINVKRMYTTVFVLCGSFAALGGLIAAARVAAANQASGAGDVNLNAIAAAVIGGTSLFGGRGSAFSALLSILVIRTGGDEHRESTERRVAPSTLGCPATPRVCSKLCGLDP